LIARQNRAAEEGDTRSDCAGVAAGQKPWIVPIPGTTKLHRLDENIGAVAVELTPDDLRDIDSAASKITVQGARYPEKLEQMTGR
jgi:aryl-alcohol dehydrogenase-like predicted oxidoreductase